MMFFLREKFNLEYIKYRAQRFVSITRASLNAYGIDATLLFVAVPPLILQDVTSLIARLYSRVISNTQEALDPNLSSTIFSLPEPSPTQPAAFETGIVNFFDRDWRSIIQAFTPAFVESANYILQKLDQYIIKYRSYSGRTGSGFPLPIVPVDSFLDLYESMPVTNDPLITQDFNSLSEMGYDESGSRLIPEEVQEFKIVDNLRRAYQSFSITELLETLNDLTTQSVGGIYYIRSLLKSLAASSELYEPIVNSNIFAGNVSDNVGLLTFGHTIDTPGLDPEDWWTNYSIETSQDRIVFGPARLLPQVVSSKISTLIADNIQTAYDNLNKKMYFNLFRDRYYNRNPEPGEGFDYPISRLKTINKFGMVSTTSSHINQGDYFGGAGFAKTRFPVDYEIVRSQVSTSLYPLIGSLYRLNNFNKLDAKPIYSTVVQEEKINITSSGDRFILPATASDNTHLTV